MTRYAVIIVISNFGVTFLEHSVYRAYNHTPMYQSVREIWCA